MLYVTDFRQSAVVELSALDAGTAWRLLPIPAALGRLHRPMGLSRTGDGRLLVADRGRARIVALHPEDDGLTQVLDPAGSEAGALREPSGVTMAADGSVIVADTGNHRLVRASALQEPAWSAYGVAGSGSPHGFVAPTGVHVDGLGRILVADPGAGRLVRVDDFDGNGWTEIPLPEAGRPARPYALAAGPAESVWIADLPNSRVLRLAADDSVEVVLDGAGDRSLIAPAAIAPLGEDLVVADAAAARLTRWTLDPDTLSWTAAQSLAGEPGPAGGPSFSGLCGLAIQEAL